MKILSGAALVLLLAAPSPRVRPLPDSEWTDLHRSLAATYWHDGPVSNYFRSFLNHPELVKGVMPFEQYILHGTALTPRHLELLILRTAWLSRNDYLWNRHAPSGRSAGLTRDELTRIAKGPDAAGWDPFDATLLRVADELHVDANISDGTWAALTARFDTRKTMDAVFAVAEYTMLADTFNSIGVPPDAPSGEHLPRVEYRAPAAGHTPPARAARIPPIAQEALTPELRRMLDPRGSGRPAAAVYRTYAQDPDLYPSRQLLSEYIRAKATLPPRVRELLILRIGALCGTEYEWAAHAPAGRRAGLTDAEIRRIYVGPDGQGDSFDEALLHAVDELYKDDTMSDATWRTLTTRFDDRQMLDLLITTAGYRMASMAMNAFGVQLEPNGERFPAASTASARPGADWTAPGGNWAATRYSALDQITTKNIKQLGGAWVVDAPERTEATPLLSGGRMFVVTANGQILALDPATGSTLWTFKPEVPFGGKRGVGIGDGLLFAGLRNSNVIAISQETGQVVWTFEHGSDIPSQGMSSAPAYGNGVVVAVVSLGDNFLRGRAIAIDAKTGKGLWSWDVVPGPGQPGHETWPQDSDIWKYGGGALWTTPSVDADLGLVYLETGNAVPQYGGELRPGNNLFDNSVVALELKTGRMRWYYQLVHHDIWEHDVSTPLILYDTAIGGRTRKALAAMRTDGILFILDRETGQPIVPVEERPVKQNRFLNTSPTQPFTAGGDRIGPECVDTAMIPPGFVAGCYFDPITVETPNLYLPHMNMRQTPMAYSPQTNYLYATSCVNPAWMKRATTGWEFIQPTRLPGQRQYGLFAAIDARTAKIVWQKRLPYSECEGSGGALTTAGGLVFHEEPDGNLQAYDAKTGALLWQFQTGQAGLGGGAGPSGAAAMSYELGGTQYIALANNRAVWAFTLGGAVAPKPAPRPPAVVREWPARIADTSTIEIGNAVTFNIVAANRKIEWLNDYAINPTRARVKAGTAVTWANKSTLPNTIVSRDGSWTTGLIAPGASGSVTITAPGTYEYYSKEHPWSFGQLVVD